MDNKEMSKKDIINKIIGQALDEIKEQTGLSLDAKVNDKTVNFYPDEEKSIQEMQMFYLSDIERIVTECLNIKPDALRNRSRTRESVDARTIYTHIARKYNFTVTKIGEHIHRDHTTAIHHTKKAEDLFITDERFVGKYNKVLNTIKERYAKVIY